jgi:hypothetical protein
MDGIETRRLPRIAARHLATSHLAALHLTTLHLAGTVAHRAAGWLHAGLHAAARAWRSWQEQVRIEELLAQARAHEPGQPGYAADLRCAVARQHGIDCADERDLHQHRR